MTFDELSSPATQQDVQAGRAVFTFEGLGRSRVWKLPACPVYAIWPDFKDNPVTMNTGATHYRNSGYVCQAEEINVDGVWKRYFGFVCESGVAVVPADRIRLWIKDAKDLSYQHLPGGLDWGVKVPRKVAEGRPVILQVYLRNRVGAARQTPTDWYRGPDAGGPALRKGVSIKLKFAPFNPRSADEYYPNHSDYRPVTSRRSDSFAATTAGRRLETGESVHAFDLDLRDWFSMDAPGYYSVQFDHDRELLGWPLEETEGPVAVNYGFVVGTEPKRLTTAELNATIPPLGGQGESQRLRDLIKHTPLLSDAAAAPGAIKPAASTRPAAPGDLPPPVNGLSARIDNVDLSVSGVLRLMLRMTNASDRAIRVPAGMAPAAKQPFELQMRRGDLPWERVEWSSRDDRHEDVDPVPPVELKPGESVAIALSAMNERLASASAIRLNIESKVDGQWHGSLQTPPTELFVTEEKRDAGRGSLPFPDHFPEFSRVSKGGFAILMGGNGSGNEADLERMQSMNWFLAQSLALYEPSAVRAVLESRSDNEKEPTSKLYLSALAARFGSRAGALRILEALESADYNTIRDAHAALALMMRGFDKELPDWLVELTRASLKDARYATGLEKTNWAKGTTFTLSYLADEYGDLTMALAHFRVVQSVPLLIDMVRQEETSRMAIIALGDIGDARAIPVLLEVLQQSEGNLKIFSGMLLPENFRRAATSLGTLKAKEATPLLIKHLCHADIVKALEAIGDPAAIPALEALVSSGKPVQINGSTTDVDRKAVWAARIALVTLRQQDPIPMYCTLLADRELGEFTRREIVWRLGNQPDPRAIPHLMTAIKTDPSGAVVNQAITVLSVFKYKAAVSGLIECFDADFEGKSDWKRAHKPDMFRQNIADSLRTLTGQSIGAEKASWEKWWQETGSRDSQLQ